MHYGYKVEHRHIRGVGRGGKSDLSEPIMQYDQCCICRGKCCICRGKKYTPYIIGRFSRRNQLCKMANVAFAAANDALAAAKNIRGILILHLQR